MNSNKNPKNKLRKIHLLWLGIGVFIICLAVIFLWKPILYYSTSYYYRYYYRIFSGERKPLQNAAVSGDTSEIEGLLAEGANINEKGEGYTALHWAVIGGRVHVTELLIKRGADIEARGWLGHTPLIEAITHNRKEVAQILLSSGANPNLPDRIGWAPLHHAVKPTVCYIDLIQLLIDFGADINITDSHGRTPLHRAAQFGHLDGTLLLLQNGANPKLIDERGLTPADRAALYPEIQSLLMSEKSHNGSQVSKSAEFPEYFSEKHNFKVRFLGKAKVTDYGLVTHYTVEIEGEGAYNIFVNLFPKPVLGDEAIQAALDGHLQGRLTLFGDKATVLESRHIVFEEHKALQYEYTVESQGTNAYFRGVYFIVGKLGYGISVVCTEETKPSAYSKYKDFVESFRLTVYSDGIKANLTEEEAQEAINWGAENKDTPVALVRPHAFGNVSAYTEWGYIATKFYTLADLGLDSAKRHKRLKRARIQDVLSAKVLPIVISTLGNEVDFAKHYRIVLRQGKKVVQPVSVRAPAWVGKTSLFPESPSYRALIRAAFPYSEIDLKAKTTIIFIKDEEEISFEVDFSRYK